MIKKLHARGAGIWLDKTTREISKDKHEPGRYKLFAVIHEVEEYLPPFLVTNFQLQLKNEAYHFNDKNLHAPGAGNWPDETTQETSKDERCTR